ncbi:secretory phospholipase A2 receptor-like isoform X2 [Rhynchophorus ferrugineus]|uniref:secretory phospholipase A2 receptor-like isoform X2 n=1 Tax=Rhynchophorus ferrugineus TaxID=354439 RepID=UPI003FCC3EDF
MDKIFLVLLCFTYSVFANHNESLNYRYACPDKFTAIGRKCYRFYGGTSTWFQAFYACKNLNDSTLTIFSNRQELLQFESFLVKDKLKTVGQNRTFWVGAFKDWQQKKWIYTDGTPVKYLSLREFSKNGHDNWTCLLVDTQRNRWRSENCMNSIPFVCETEAKMSVEFKTTDKKIDRRSNVHRCVERYNSLTDKQKKKCQKLKKKMAQTNSESKTQAAYPSKPTTKGISYLCPQNWMLLGNQCYLFSTKNATWSDAHFNCASINAHLAIIKTKAQDKKLRIYLNQFTERKERWIGGRYNGKTNEWVWALNARPLQFKGFAEEVLQNSTIATEWQALIVDPQYSYQWNFRNEMEEHCYICQVKGRMVKKLRQPRGTTIEITSHPRYKIRSTVGERSKRNKRH